MAVRGLSPLTPTPYLHCHITGPHGPSDRSFHARHRSARHNRGLSSRCARRAVLVGAPALSNGEVAGESQKESPYRLTSGPLILIMGTDTEFHPITRSERTAEMAQKVTVQLLDDLDGKSEAQQTVKYAIDGAAYEIDLTDSNAKKMRDSLQKYIDASRKATNGSSGRGRRAGRGPTPDYDPKAVRVWAESSGKEVPARGRIPGALLDEYRAAGN